MSNYDKMTKKQLISMIEVGDKLNNRLLDENRKLRLSLDVYDNKNCKLIDELRNAKDTIFRMANDETMRRDYEE